MNLLKTALIAVSFIVYPLSYAQDEIGVAAAVNTKTVDMVAYPGGNIENRNVDPGYKIISNRTIQTNKSGKAQMLLVDGTAFTIGPNSTVTLDKFIYDPATASGRLEVSAKGLVRLVGGKVTKKRPAIIKTSTATVGIRGGIAIVEATPEETKASFVYGVEMEVAPLKNPDNSLVLTQVGLSVEVEADSDEVEEPELITSEELDDYSDDFEGNEEPENEESEDESNSEKSSEDSESDAEDSESGESGESEDSESEDSESEDSESEESEESDNEESEESDNEESDETDESETEESDNEESDETETEESEDSNNEESESEELEDSEETEESNDTEESNETDNAESDQTDSEEADNSENSNDDSTEEENSIEQDSEESNDAESSESETETQSSETNDELDQDSEDEQSPQVNESTDNEETSSETSSQDDEIVETNSPEEDSSLDESSDGSNNQVTDQNTDSDSLETSDDTTQDESSSSVTTNSASSANEENPLTNSSNNDTSVNNSSGQNNNENSDGPLVVASSSSSEDSPPEIQTDDEKSIEDKPVIQPPTSTSSSDSVTLTQPPISTSSSDSVPLTQPPVSTPSSDLITIEPESEDPEPVIPEIDESLLDNFDISKNTSDTGIDNLTTAYDQGGELFIDDTQIESQEEEFIEEAAEANEEVQVEEVQQETKVEAVVEAQLSTNTSFLQNNVREDILVGSSLGKIEVEYTGSDNIRFAIGGPGSDNFEMDQNGNIILKEELDFEEKQTYNLLVFTFLGDKSITNKLDLNVINVNEISASVNLSSTEVHEGTATESTVGNIDVSGVANPSYSLVGENSDDFFITLDGEIKLKNSLDYASASSYELKLKIEGKNDTVDIPLEIKIGQNKDPDFLANCKNSCSLVETASEGSVISDSSRIDNDSDELNFSLADSYNGKFIIDSNTGEVKLNGNLDFESKNSYSLKVIATDSKGATKDQSFTFNVADNSIPVRSKSLNNQNLVGNKLLSVEPTDNESRIYVSEDIGRKDASKRILFDLNQGNLPEGSTYSISGDDASKYYVDSSGLVRIKSGVVIDDQISQELSGEALINHLAGLEQPAEKNDHEDFEDKISLNVNIPNEPNQDLNLKIVSKKIESQENVVMKFASGYSNVSHSLASAFKAEAIRGDGNSKNYNSSVSASGTTITESTLSTSQLAGNEKINSATSLVNGNPSSYAESNGISAYRTNTVANGLNENDTEILDFEYLFPINNQSGASKTGSTYTKGQYAPLSVANADWDNVMNANEKAKYGCYDSGQGCGSQPHELTLSGSMQQEITDDGYLVKDWNLDMNESELANGNYLLNADPSGENTGTGLGVDTLIHSSLSLSGESHPMQGGEAEFFTVALPESFEYFGNNFTYLHINENGFITLDNDAIPPYDDLLQDNLSNGQNRGAFPLSYFDEAKHFEGGDSPIDWSFIPQEWGKPGTAFAGNLNNSIFALIGGYNTEGYDSESDFSIRTLWNSSSKIYTVGWYNLKSGKSSDSNAEVNFEIQFNLNDDSFKIVHGNFGNRFPDATTNQDSSLHNYFTGISKDLSCLTTGEDISACEGKNYIQLIFFDSYEGTDIDTWNPIQTFQNPNGNNYSNGVDKMFNSYFASPGTGRNGSIYCYVGDASGGLSSPCESTYTGSLAGLDLQGRMYDFSPRDGNILLPSNIKQSYRVGDEAEFMWMHLNKPSSSLTYTPPEDNASGFEAGANNNDSVNSGTLNSGNAVSTTTFADEIVIGGEVYKDSELKSFLNNTKKVVAFAPIPVLHTNKYEMLQSPSSTDVRFKHVHTIMPQFISDEFMEDQANGTDLRFDFHQLADHDYSKSGNHLRYGTEGDNSFNLQNQFAADHNEADIDGMYGFAADVLEKEVSSRRFSDTSSGAEFTIPEGQSLWQQVFNPHGRGAGIFVQMNWSCGAGGTARCNEVTSSRDSGPHKTQQSLFSVLISEVGDKAFFEEGPLEQGRYTALNSGQVMQGEHFWTYKRRSSRTTSTDGIYAVTDQTPQLSFGTSPIACVSGKDNGCFFGDGQSYDSNIAGAPSTAIISTDDPCKAQSLSGCLNNMELGVMHSMAQTTNDANPEYSIGTFYQGIIQQQQKDSNDNSVDAINLSGSNSWRSGQSLTSDNWSGMMTGLLITDTNNGKNPHPQYITAKTTTTFDDVNDKVKVQQNSLNIFSRQNPDINTNDWYDSKGVFSGDDANLAEVSTLSGFQFGDADSNSEQPYYGSDQWAPSTYLNKKVFGAILKGQNVGLEDKAFKSNGSLDASLSNDNAGALVTWDTIDEKDRDFMMDGATEPSLEYMSWGVWGLAMSDSQIDQLGYQASTVHMGTWYAGDLLDVGDWPVSRTATLAGIAMFDVFARIEESGVTNSYHWTEGAGANGSVIFDGTGDYKVNISVDNLGSGEGVINSGFTNNMLKGPTGNITWSANGNQGEAFFQGSSSSTTNYGSEKIRELKHMWGELYGKSSHIESGATLHFSRETNSEMIMYSGSAILSE